MRKDILITGGAGYIGSHASYLLAMKKKYNVIIIDKFLHNQSFNHKWATVIKDDFANEAILKKIFSKYKIDAVMHFAAFIEVGESVKDPKRFYENNVLKTIKFLNFILEHNVKKFIFSSSCAVYGEPKKIPIDESHPLNPFSPYGKNKLAVEFALQDYDLAYGLKSVSLRYFNAAGALADQQLGEQHDPETHIIPLMLEAAKKRKPFKIFGTDYDTKDGTCIRDYVHVLDIARAHVLALEFLDKTNKSDVFNLGSGKGFSVKEMIEAAEKICCTKSHNLSRIFVEKKDRRPGDPAILLADPTKAKKILGWKPKHSDLKTIITSAEIFSRAQACQFSTSLDAHARI
jgi:UDP-glucose 4-epimerase